MKNIPLIKFFIPMLMLTVSHHSLAQDSKPLKIKVAMIALDDNGKLGKKIGCGDSLVFVTKEIDPTPQVLNAALKELFAMHDRIENGQKLYNSIHADALHFIRASVHNGKAHIFLAGTFAAGGMCDAPRMQAQIEQTAFQFPTINEVEVYLNKKRFDWGSLAGSGI
jgi:hypothetical protein